MFGQATPARNAATAFFLVLGALGFKFLVELLAIVPFFDPKSLTISAIPSYVLFWVTVASAVPLLLYIKRWNQTHDNKISAQQFFNWRRISKFALIGFVVFGFGIICLNSGLELIWPESSYVDENSLKGFEQFVVVNGLVDGIFKIMTIIFAAAVVEELLFRTFFISALRNWIGSSGAIIISAMLFTIVHSQYFAINPLLLLNVFVLAVTLGLVRILSGSVIPAIILHAVNNGISFTIINLEQLHPTAFGINELSAQFWFFVGIIFVFMSWIMMKTWMKYPMEIITQSFSEKADHESI